MGVLSDVFVTPKDSILNETTGNGAVFSGKALIFPAVAVFFLSAPTQTKKGRCEVS